MLESLLSSTGHFRRNGELLNPAYGEIWSPIRYTRGMSARMPDENFMFHLKIYHLTRDRRRPVEPGAFLNSLHEDGWNIIYLRRRNTVRHQLSNAVLEHRGGPHKFSDDPERHLIEIDCETFVERVRERVQFENAETEALRGVDFCEVTYEDGLEQVDMHQHTVDRILDHISLERRTARTKHKKVNTQDPVDLVANYDEFVEFLTKADLGHFLLGNRAPHVHQPANRARLRSARSSCSTRNGRLKGPSNGNSLGRSAENTSGLRSVLSLAPVYRLAQRLIGADHFRAVLVDEILQATPADRVSGSGLRNRRHPRPSSGHGLRRIRSESAVRR